MSEYARVESVPSAMLPFDTMRLFRYVKDKDAVWDALMDYSEAVRVRNCDLDAVPMAEFPRGLERDAYLSFCETIRKTVEGYWRRVEQNAENARKRRVQPEKEKAEPEAVQAEAKETGTVQCAAKECEPNKHSEGDAERQTVQTGLQESRSVPQESRNVRLAAMVGPQETVDARWEAKACDPVPQSEGKGDREPVGTEWVTNGYPSGGQINKRINKSINQESNKENKPYVSSLSAPSGADARVCARVREDGADPFGDGMGDAYAFTSGPKDGDTPEQEGPAK